MTNVEVRIGVLCSFYGTEGVLLTVLLTVILATYRSTMSNVEPNWVQCLAGGPYYLTVHINKKTKHILSYGTVRYGTIRYLGDWAA